MNLTNESPARGKGEERCSSNPNTLVKSILKLKGIPTGQIAQAFLNSTTS